MTNLPMEAIQLAGAFIEGYLSTLPKNSQDRLALVIDSIAQKLKRGTDVESALGMARTYGHVLASKLPFPTDKVIAGLETIDAVLTFSHKKENPNA